MDEVIEMEIDDANEVEGKVEVVCPLNEVLKVKKSLEDRGGFFFLFLFFLFCFFSFLIV